MHTLACSTYISLGSSCTCCSRASYQAFVVVRVQSCWCWTATGRQLAPVKATRCQKSGRRLHVWHCVLMRVFLTPSPPCLVKQLMRVAYDSEQWTGFARFTLTGR